MTYAVNANSMSRSCGWVACLLWPPAKLLSPLAVPQNIHRLLAF